jgi:NAD(P)-dependent dehydrogenase (short-subunit alcohol dehydrogenase family)
LGRATAKLFASKGWKVIASMRDPKKEKELGGISGIHLMSLDVTDPDQIESVAEHHGLRGLTVETRWDEKAGLRRGCGVRSQVIDVLKASQTPAKLC